MAEILKTVNEIVWGVPALFLIIGVGVYLTLRTGFAQFRLFPAAVRAFAGKLKGKSDRDAESSFKALCTALAATVGTGNIAGVAGAIGIGGPGSIFWMWVCALLGMVTKFAEAALSVHYRHRLGGETAGGPMYMIEKGMGHRWRWLGICYCLCGVVAAFGIGNATQINAVIDSVNSAFVAANMEVSLPLCLAIGVLLAVLTTVSLLGGAKRIGSIAVLLVPAASAAYIVLSAGAIAAHGSAIPEALQSIVSGAFSPEAATGGLLGSAFIALRVGASRGVFTNEAGMGTAAIAHGASRVEHPVEQGLMGIMEVFLDTIVICTLTALVILTSGTPIPYALDEGAQLTTRAFACTYGPWVSVPISMFLCCFAFATMLGWGLYGLRCAQYLFGEKSWKPFVLVQAVAAVASVLLQTGTVWLLSEIVNGLMAIPNLIMLAALSPQLADMTRDYIKKQSARRRSDGGDYQGISRDNRTDTQFPSAS